MEFENHEEVVKILKVRYIRVKEIFTKYEEKSLKPTKKKIKSSKPTFLEFDVNDENNNQRLVNL